MCHPSIYFNNKSVKQVPPQKHLGMILDNKLNFQEHLKNILNKVNKITGLLRKLQNILPREPLLTTYKSFVRPHLDYGVIYDQHYNNSFHQKLESTQYYAALAITGASRTQVLLGQHIEQEIISTTFLGSMSNTIVSRTSSSRPLKSSRITLTSFVLFKKSILQFI